MAFDPTQNPGRNKIASPSTTTAKSASTAAYYGPTGAVTKTMSNGLNLTNIAAYEAASDTGKILEGFTTNGAVLRTASNFAYFLLNGADAAALFSKKDEYGGKSA